MQNKGKRPQTDPVLEQALSHPKRLDILGYLMKKRGAEAGEGELVKALGLPAPRVKYHLLVLQGAGLIAYADDREQGYVAAASASQ